jgi:hypothetical protein
MAKISTMVMTGNAMVTARLLKLAGKYKSAAAIALNLETAETLAKAVSITPRKTGRLQRSGRIKRLATPFKLESRLGYGTRYALAVHEIPPPPKTSVGNRSARHRKPFGRGGQWKYLEFAIRVRAPKFSKRIANDITKLIPKMYKYKEGVLMVKEQHTFSGKNII